MVLSKRQFGNGGFPGIYLGRKLDETFHKNLSAEDEMSPNTKKVKTDIT